MAFNPNSYATAEDCDKAIRLVDKQIKEDKKRYDKIMFDPQKDQEEASDLIQEISKLSQQKDIITIRKNQLIIASAEREVDALCERITKLNQLTANRSSIFGQPPKDQIEKWKQEKEGLVNQLTQVLVKIQVSYRTLLPLLEAANQDKMKNELRNAMRTFQETFLSPPSSARDTEKTHREKTRYEVMQSLEKGKPSSTGEAALNAASTLTSEETLRPKLRRY